MLVDNDEYDGGIIFDDLHVNVDVNVDMNVLWRIVLADEDVILLPVEGIII